MFVLTWFRFSLLLLEFGEIYFEDFSAVYFSLGNGGALMESVDRCVYVRTVDFHANFVALNLRKQRGRMKICSQSLIFEPLIFSDPVIKVCIWLQIFV